MTGAAHHRGASRQDYETPWELIRAVATRFGQINWDLAADGINQKAPNYLTENEDALEQPWSEFHVAIELAWLNPPFSNIRPWAAKCAAEAALGVRVALLVPASVGSEWFAAYVYERALVLPLRPRVSFDGKNPYPKDLMLCVYGEEPGFEPWRWKE
jgi:phage N-6-adenine-methyltransferase